MSKGPRICILMIICLLAMSIASRAEPVHLRSNLVVVSELPLRQGVPLVSVFSIRMPAADAASLLNRPAKVTFARRGEEVGVPRTGDVEEVTEFAFRLFPIIGFQFVQRDPRSSFSKPVIVSDEGGNEATVYYVVTTVDIAMYRSEEASFCVTMNTKIAERHYAAATEISIPVDGRFRPRSEVEAAMMELMDLGFPTTQPNVVPKP
jgi:hypothetical protein